MRWKLEDMAAPLPGVKLLSTDVFDTLLLRGGTSERGRIVAGERSFSVLISRSGHVVGTDFLVQARLDAQRLAFRAITVGGDRGDVRLGDIIARQLWMLGLPQSLSGARLAIEVDIEKTALKANTVLADVLRRQHAAGVRVVAVSDTTLPAQAVQELITHFHDRGLVERIYSSADEGMTKRQGDLFGAVMATEGVAPREMVHIGDDEIADSHMPAAHGVGICPTPRAAIRRHLSRGHGALTEIGLRLRRRHRAAASPVHAPQDALAFGRDVFGPIIAQFCMRICLYADQARSTDRIALLFCARGGIGIREAFERFLSKVGAPPGWDDDEVVRENLMISRLVAARAAIAAGNPVVLDELGREFGGRTFREVSKALGTRDHDLPDEWSQIFEPGRFFAMLATHSARDLKADIMSQNALFARHFRQVAGRAQRIILCDTGLYGSTQRLLAAGFPEMSIETIQFARTNYKKLPEDHFPRVVGLVVEGNAYNPFSIETSVLRYWQLIESLFEPTIPSVRTFEENADGEVLPNSGPITRSDVDPAVGNPLLTGALQYIDGLPTAGGATVLRDAEIAWRSLKRAITNPTGDDLGCIEVGLRSVDFGRSEQVRVIDRGVRPGYAARLEAIKRQMWREGAIVREFPTLKTVLLPMLEAIHAVRGLSLRALR